MTERRPTPRVSERRRLLKSKEQILYLPILSYQGRPDRRQDPRVNGEAVPLQGQEVPTVEELPQVDPFP